MKKYTSLIYFLACIFSVNAQVADKITVLNNDLTGNPPPSSFSQEVRFHNKWNNSIGVPHIGSPGPGTYSALMTIAPWSDGTGSKHHQINFNEDGLFWRKGLFGASWEAWKRIVTADQNGNVGIGTTAPGNRLEVFGSSFNRVSATVNSDVQTGFQAKKTGTNAVDWEFYIPAASTDFRFYNPLGGDVLTFKSNGNIGIGTADPDAKLAVKGHIHAQEVRLDLNGAMAPDYVFEQNYPLLSLTDLETYIAKNKHLPEVPSSRQMEEEGLNLKEMNLLLLKKVEELTLYVIDQSKTIDGQNATIRKLEDKIIGAGKNKNNAERSH